MDWALSGAAVAAGAWHTLWTCHLVHYDAGHLLGDAVAIAAPLLLLGRAERMRALAALPLIAPLLAAALLLEPGLGEYRGSSGLACALWAWLAVARRDRVGALAGLLLAARLALDLALGPAPRAGWITSPTAHLTGAALGAVAACVVRRMRASRRAATPAGA